MPAKTPASASGMGENADAVKRRVSWCDDIDGQHYHLATRMADESHTDELYLGPGADLTLFPLRRLANIVVCLAIGWIAYQQWDDARVTIDPVFRVNLMGESYPGATHVEALRAITVKQLKHVYSADTPIAKLIEGCPVANCVRPEVKSPDAFRQFALAPGRYESDLCTFFSHSKWFSGGPTDSAPTWSLDPRESMCSMTNEADERLAADKATNSTRKVIVCAVAIALVYLILANLVVRPKKPV